ncbi:RNA polymerase sigma factor [Amycolatopsis sp. cmx-4-83]|uniref:RNA polymerase sigma factor n=1 Tax=Amycolatopsis sp. cmx-4-83 TaxID=2790940 RepID=UPI0039791A55
MTAALTLRRARPAVVRALRCALPGGGSGHGVTDSARPPTRRPWTEQRRRALTSYVRRPAPNGDHDNVVGEAPLALYQRWDRIDGDKPAWLYRVARNKAADATRHREAGHAEIDESAGVADKAAPIGVWTPPGPGERLLFVEAIGALPRRLGLPLTLLEKGWRVEDIAEYMGLPASTVGISLSRAKNYLNRLLTAADEVRPVHRSERRDRWLHRHPWPISLQPGRRNAAVPAPFHDRATALLARISAFTIAADDRIGDPVAATDVEAAVQEARTPVLPGLVLTVDDTIDFGHRWYPALTSDACLQIHRRFAEQQFGRWTAAMLAAFGAPILDPHRRLGALCGWRPLVLSFSGGGDWTKRCDHCRAPRCGLRRSRFESILGAGRCRARRRTCCARRGVHCRRDLVLLPQQECVWRDFRRRLPAVANHAGIP